MCADLVISAHLSMISRISTGKQASVFAGLNLLPTSRTYIRRTRRIVYAVYDKMDKAIVDIRLCPGAASVSHLEHPPFSLRPCVATICKQYVILKTGSTTYGIVVRAAASHGQGQRAQKIQFIWFFTSLYLPSSSKYKCNVYNMQLATVWEDAARHEVH